MQKFKIEMEERIQAKEEWGFTGYAEFTRHVSYRVKVTRGGLTKYLRNFKIEKDAEFMYGLLQDMYTALNVPFEAVKL